MRILEIGESDFDSFMATSAAVEPSPEGLRGEIDTSHFFKAGAVYEITALELPGSEGSAETLLGGRDFPRTVFLTKRPRTRVGVRSRKLRLFTDCLESTFSEARIQNRGCKHL